MTETIVFLARHGYSLLFFWILAEQSAIPLPSFPLLLAAGALAHSGNLNPFLAIASCLAATLIADTVWFYFGRHSGPKALRLLQRLPLKPDVYLGRTETFSKHLMRSLLVAKFVPGLNALAAPMAGNSAAGLGR